MARARGIAIGYKIGSNAGNIYWLDNSGYYYLHSRRLNLDHILIEKFIRGVLGSKYCRGLFLYDKSMVHGSEIIVNCMVVDSDYYFKGLKVEKLRRKKGGRRYRRGIVYSSPTRILSSMG